MHQLWSMFHRLNEHYVNQADVKMSAVQVFVSFNIRVLFNRLLCCLSEWLEALLRKAEASAAVSLTLFMGRRSLAGISFKHAFLSTDSRDRE